MSQNTPAFRMSLLATSIALALMNAACGGAADTTAAVTEAAVAGADATTLTIDETSRRRRVLEKLRTIASAANSSATTVPTTVTSTPTVETSTSSTSPTTSSAQTAPTTATPNTTTTSVQSPTSDPKTTPQSTIDPKTLPLIQESDFQYVGAFATPDPTGYGWGWNGKAIAIYKDPITKVKSLFYRGHDAISDQVAQITIPPATSQSKIFSELPKSTFIQQPQSITEGALDTNPSGIGDAGGNGAFIYGIHQYGNQLIVSASTAYSYQQTAALGISDSNLSATGDFRGFFALTGKVALQRAMGGSMTQIPDEWQIPLGGKVIVGNAPTSVISANSFGPAMTVFDPEKLGSSNAAETLVFYPPTNPLCGTANCEQSLNSSYTWMSGDDGRAFPKGSRTVLTIGKHPAGEMWYGGPTSPTSGAPAFCNDGGWGQKATAMESRIQAFDANDLLAVKNGQKQTWEVKPYAKWRIPVIERTSCWNILSSTFDTETGLLYIVVRDAEITRQGNRIEVFRISK